MAELVVMNGAGNIARSVVSAHLRRHAGRYASVKVVDARPYRQSVYHWQATLDGNVKVNKALARSVDSLNLSLEGAKDVVYFTHDYVTMSSDKNSHLQAVAQIAKKQGNNLVAVCPIESDLAWSEDEQSYAEKTKEAEAAALQANPSMTLFKTNLTFGPETHLIHFLAQCALVGKAPYKAFVARDHLNFKYAPIHTDDVAEAVGAALEDASASGHYMLAGKEHYDLSQILAVLEKAADRGEGSTKGPTLPPLEYVWEFFFGTGNDQNLARMVKFYESEHQHIQALTTNTWAQKTGMEPAVSFNDFYSQIKIAEEDYAHPTMMAYKCTHLD